MNNKYSKENVQIGDRVLVSGCGEEHTEKHWGTVLNFVGPIALDVRMEDTTLRPAMAFRSESGEKCYRAYWTEVHDLVKVGGTPIFPRGRILAANTEPNPLQKVIEDLTATHRYLEQVTGKKYAAHLQGVALDTGNGYDSNEVTVKFVMEAK